jgi:hypothetical protein
LTINSAEMTISPAEPAINSADFAITSAERQLTDPQSSAPIPAEIDLSSAEFDATSATPQVARPVSLAPVTKVPRPLTPADPVTTRFPGGGGGASWMRSRHTDPAAFSVPASRLLYPIHECNDSSRATPVSVTTFSPA